MRGAIRTNMMSLRHPERQSRDLGGAGGAICAPPTHAGPSTTLGMTFRLLALDRGGDVNSVCLSVIPSVSRGTWGAVARFASHHPHRSLDYARETFRLLALDRGGDVNSVGQPRGDESGECGRGERDGERSRDQRRRRVELDRPAERL